MLKKILDVIKTIWALILLVLILLLDGLLILFNPIHRLLSCIIRFFIHPTYEDIVEIYYYEENHFEDTFVCGITIINKDKADQNIKYVDKKTFNKAVKELKSIKFFNTPSRYAELSDLDYRELQYIDGGSEEIRCVITLKNGKKFRVDSTVFYPKKVEQYKNIVEKYYFGDYK